LRNLALFFSAVSLENNSVGEIYDFISEALRCKTVEFQPESIKFQFGPGEAYAPKVKDAGGDVYVKNLEDALEAIKIIVEQGEGRRTTVDVSVYDDKSHEEKSHYARFKVVKKQLDKVIIKVWDLPTDPELLPYPDNLQAVSELFNASYTYLLRTIDLLYLTAGDDRKKLIWTGMFPIMTNILPNVAKTLIREKLPGGKHAAPKFQFYKFQAGKWNEQILQLYQNAVFVNNSHGKLLERLALVLIPIQNLHDLQLSHNLQKPSEESSLKPSSARSTKDCAQCSCSTFPGKLNSKPGTKRNRANK